MVRLHGFLRLLLFLLLFALSTPLADIVVLKLAMDKNGFIGSLKPVSPPPSITHPASDTPSNSNPSNFRFTSPASLDLVHRLRSHCDFLITSSTTVTADNPSFTCRRGYDHKSLYNEDSPQTGPTRVVLDRSLKTFQFNKTEPLQILTHREPNDQLNDPPTIIYHAQDKAAPADQPSVSFRPLPAPCLPSSLHIIESLSNNVMIEGGGTLAELFAPHVTHAILITSPHEVFPTETAVDGHVSDRENLVKHGLRLVGTTDEEGDAVEYWKKSDHLIDKHFLEHPNGLLEFLLPVP